MVNRALQSKKRYFISILIGTAVFLFILGISYSMALFQYTRVSNLQGVTAYSLFEKKSSHTFFGEDICSEKNLKEISISLGQQGKLLEDLENKFGKEDKQVLERKKFYSVLLLEHLDYVNLYNEKCEPKMNTVLFFYSNLRGASASDLSEKAGMVLDTVGSQNEVVSIYSFDINLESTIIEKLKERYNITLAPVVVVNNETIINWPFSSRDVENKLIPT
jgi:hypothetical protein